MTAPATRHMMMLTDQEISMLRHRISSTRTPVTVEGAGGRVATFRLRGGKLVAKESRPDGTVVRYEVASESEIRRMMARPDATPADPEQLERMNLMAQIRADHPDYTEEKVDYMTDIVMESRKTMLKLISTGIEPKAAQMMVTEALRLSEMDRERLRGISEQYFAEHPDGVDAPVATYEPVVIPAAAPPTEQPAAKPQPEDPMGGMF